VLRELLELADRVECIAPHTCLERRRDVLRWLDGIAVDDVGGIDADWPEQLELTLRSDLEVGSERAKRLQHLGLRVALQRVVAIDGWQAADKVPIPLSDRLEIAGEKGARPIDPLEDLRMECLGPVSGKFETAVMFDRSN
jgi:hypothetical protein